MAVFLRWWKKSIYMNKCRYRVICSVQTEFRAITYGIAVYRYQYGGWHLIQTIHDISADQAAVVQLAARCQRLRLAPEHLSDVVENFFAII